MSRGCRFQRIPAEMFSPLRLVVLLAACLGASAFTSPVGAPSRITQSRFQTTFAASQVRQTRPLAPPCTRRAHWQTPCLGADFSGRPDCSCARGLCRHERRGSAAVGVRPAVRTHPEPSSTFQDAAPVPTLARRIPRTQDVRSDLHGGPRHPVLRDRAQVWRLVLSASSNHAYMVRGPGWCWAAHRLIVMRATASRRGRRPRSLCQSKSL